MLKPVVEEYHGATELTLGEAPGQVAIGAHQNRHSWECAREHLRLIAGSLDPLEHARSIAGHDDPVDGMPTGVPATEDGRSLARIQEQAGKRRHDGRLAAAAHGQIAHADDRAIEVAPRLRVVLVP